MIYPFHISTYIHDTFHEQFFIVSVDIKDRTIYHIHACEYSFSKIKITYFFNIGNSEYTDNAQIKQHITPVNTRVSGFIKKIYFEEYQKVKKGDTLLVIEDSEYLLRLAQAEANYQNALAGKDVMHTTINTTQNNILVSDASVKEAKIRLENAEKDFNRYSELIKKQRCYRSTIRQGMY